MRFDTGRKTPSAMICNILFPHRRAQQSLTKRWNQGGVAASIAAMSENKTKLLVVDDDARLRQLLIRYLGVQGYSARAVANATDMNRLLARERYYIKRLETMPPWQDGL